jgi:glycosyltransferase involved in cell wall biosynthesis
VQISVVTVCWNAAATLAATLDSFFAQTHPDKELIVIDGASTDDTLSIVNRYACAQLTVISELDRGLYDAMNKGLAVFRGDAVGFLNADDRYRDESALAAIAEALGGADACFGDLDFVDRSGLGRVVRRWRATPWRKGAFRRGWMPAHPTFYCRRDLAESVGGFDLRYRLAADYDFMLRALELNEVRAVQVRRVLVEMGDGGRASASVAARLRHNLEALDSRRRWLGAGLVDYALFAKPLSKAGQFAGAIAE